MAFIRIDEKTVRRLPLPEKFWQIVDPTGKIRAVKSSTRQKSKDAKTNRAVKS